jgi:hypothetical protein
MALLDVLALLVLSGHGPVGGSAPQAPPVPWARTVLMAGAAANLVAIAGLFKSQKWAAYAFMVTSLPPMVVNLILGEPVDRTLLGMAAPALVVFLLVRSWKYLR